MEIGEYTRDLDLFQATRDDRNPRWRVSIPDGIQVVLGRSSKPDDEIHLPACQADGVPVFRRPGGGCAVVLDPGNLVVSWAGHAPGIGDNQKHFSRLSSWLIEALAAAGITGLQPAGISDLAIGDRKVAGACLHRSRDTLFYSASLLVDADIGLMDRYLKHPPREPEYRHGRSHADFVTTLAMENWTGGIEVLEDFLVDRLIEFSPHPSPPPQGGREK
jgi:lipoate-protein ligase A